MPLQLKVISEQKELLGEDYVREFDAEGGTIGRSLDNDWILPDPDHYISGKHATVDFQSGAYYLADISTNGVYINDADEPLGRGNPRRLFDGDRIRMGDFKFVVTLDEGQDLAMPPDPPASVVPDHAEQLVPEEALKSIIQMLDEEEITGDAAFKSTLFGGPAEEARVEETSEEVDEQAKPVAPPKPPKQPAPAELLDALLEAAGISRSEIHPSVDPVEVMRNAGQVLGEFIAGTTALLKSRANLKSMFRLDQTTVLPRHNNPLKLSENTKDLMKQLLVGREGEYLGPIDAVKEICRDLIFHHDAVVAAMTVSFNEFVGRLDPNELKESFDITLKKKPLFNALNQLRYWQLYCELYPIMTQRDSGEFPHIFGEEFVKEYEKQIAEFKRLEHSPGDSQPVPTVEAAADPPAKDEPLPEQSAAVRATSKN
jgi:predicted component of type VI protein secretion system